MIDRSIGPLRVSKIDTEGKRQSTAVRPSVRKPWRPRIADGRRSRERSGWHCNEFARRPPPRRKEKDNRETTHWRSALRNASATARRSIRDCTRVSSAPFRNTQTVSAGRRNGKAQTQHRQKIEKEHTNASAKTNQKKIKHETTHGLVTVEHTAPQSPVTVSTDPSASRW